jgi:peroxiredoxin
MRTKTLGLTLAALAIAGLLTFVLAGKPQPAPAVKFSMLSGEVVNTADLKGKVTLINFWATSCVTCVKEMPQISATHEKFKARGYDTIAVAMEYDPPNYVKNYAERNKLPFKVALDARGEIAKSFGDIRLTPTTFIVDKRGNIVKSFLGEPNFAELHGLIDKLLKEAA